MFTAEDAEERRGREKCNVLYPRLFRLCVTLRSSAVNLPLWLSAERSEASLRPSSSSAADFLPLDRTDAAARRPGIFSH